MPLIRNSKRSLTSFDILLVSIFALFYWIYNGLWDGSGFGTDLTRYYNVFLLIPDNLNLDAIGTVLQLDDKDAFSLILQYIPKVFGLSFNLLLLIIIFLYYRSGIHRVKKLANKSSSALKLFTIIIYSFLMLSLVNVAFRQGMSLLVILIYLFDPSKNRTRRGDFFSDIFYAIIATLIHLGTIIVFPFIFLREYIEKYRRYFDFLFYIIFILYIIGAFNSIGSYILGGAGQSFLALIRAMSNTDSDYVVGPTLSKALSIIVPVVALRLGTKRYSSTQLRNINPILIYYQYIMMIGMGLSGFPYHDRILIIGWVFLPLLLALPFLNFMVNLTKINSDRYRTAS